MAQPVEGTISQVDEIQDQIRNQERLLAQLHESILEQDKQLLGREAEAQSYASKLKKLQSKHLDDQKGHETAIQEIPGPSEQKNQTSRPSGSLTLLRQKVEENRLKVAQRGRQEQESKRELEEKVLALKSQLEEIQKVSAVTSPVTEQNPVDVNMVALEEQIQAKDSLIEARTRAITLLTEDFARKRKEVVDQLEETREEMRRMQKNFVVSEDHYKAQIQARDKRLFELDSKLRALNSKLEETEDHRFVLAEKENLQKQVNDLIAIKNEKESLEEKIKELSNIKKLYQQKEAEVCIILGEKLKLEAELAEINWKRKDESSVYLKNTQNLQKKIEKLSEQLSSNEKKMKDMSDTIKTCQANEEKLISLSLEKQNLEEKLETLTRLMDSQQQIQVERSALIEGSPHQDSEMMLLLEEKQNLQQKLKSIIEFFNVPQRELKRPSAKKHDHAKKLQEIVELSKMMLANDEKIKVFQQNRNLNQLSGTESEPVTEKLKLEEKLDQLSQLLCIYRQTIRDLFTLKEGDDVILITQSIETRDIIDEADKEELCSVIERNQHTMQKLEYLTKALNESKQELQQQSVLINACQFNETELKNDLDSYQMKYSKILQEKEQLEIKVNGFANLLKSIQHIRSKEVAALFEEKQDLRNKIDHLSKQSHDIENILQSQDNSKLEQNSQKIEALVKEKDTLQEKLKELVSIFKIIGDRCDSLSENQHHRERQFASFLEMKHEPSDVSNDHSMQESIYQLELLHQQHSEVFLMFLKDKRQLQRQVDELSKLIAANRQYMQGLSDQFTASKEQYSGEMSTLLQEKQSLEVEVQELSILIAAKEQNMQRLTNEFTAGKEQYGRELTTLLEEKQQLEIKIDELFKLAAVKEDTIQELSNQLTVTKEQLSTSLQEKRQLEIRVDELSMLVSANEQNVQGWSDELATTKEKYMKELSTLLEGKQELEMKLNELYKLVAAKEENVQELNGQLTATKEQHGEQLSTLVREKQQLELKIDELSMLVSTNEQNMQLWNDQLTTVKEQHNRELTAVTRDKQELEANVIELSKLVAEKEQMMQGLNDQLIIRKKQFNEEMASLLQEQQPLEVKIHELFLEIGHKEQNVQLLNHQIAVNQEQYNKEFTALLQDNKRLEVELGELSKLISAKDEEVEMLGKQLVDSGEEHCKVVDTLLLEGEEREVHIQETLDLLNSKNQALEELQIELNNIRQSYNKELLSVSEEKQALQDTINEKFTVIADLEEKVERLHEQLQCQLVENEEFSTWLKEKDMLPERITELSHLIASKEQEIQALKDHLEISQQQHLEVKQQLECEVTRLTSLTRFDENSLKALMDQLTATQKDLTARIEEKRQLEEKCLEYSILLESSDQRLIALNEEKEDILAQLEAKQTDKQHISEGNEQLFEEQFQQKSVALSAHMPLTGGNLYGGSESQHHQGEWSALVTDRQLLQQQVQELFYYLKHNMQCLKELRVNGGDEIRTEIADSLDDKSYEQIDLQSVLAEYKANLEQVKKQMLYTLTLSQEKQTLEDHLKNIQSQLYSQIEEKTDTLTIVMQEKAALENRVDEVSRILKTADERGEQLHQQNTILREQLNSLAKENVSNAMIIDLQNRIAELEEEKGNLQLHLVDFEELKAEGADLTAEVESLRSQKVAAEMKGVELEEELDLLKREDNTALIDSLKMQLKGQVDTCNRLTETLMEREMELGNTQNKNSNLEQQTQEQIAQIQATVQAKETAVDSYKKRLADLQASLNEVLEINNCIKCSIEKFCSDVVHGSLDEQSSHIQLIIDDSSDSLEKMSYLEPELFSILSTARCILTERESLLQSLQAEISKNHDQILSYENTLQELEFSKTENELLQSKVNDLQLTLIDKQKEIDEASLLKDSSEKRHSADESVYSQLKQLEQEKEKLAEELKSAQVRSGKLIKKIKSLKTDYDLLAAENLKLSKAVNLGPNVKQDSQIASLQQEVVELQAQLQKKVKKMDEASTQANDDHLTWLNNEYENVKHEVQHLLEEIEYKDAKSSQLTEQLLSNENTIEELAKTVESLTKSLQEREHKLVHFEKLAQEHDEKNDNFPSKDVESHRKELDHVLHILREKVEEIAHLEELLQQRMVGESEDEQTHKDVDEPLIKQLDDALYMLHQKEVRCDELTRELIELLEERDTLQLRLSTTIRQFEELRTSCSHSQEKCVQSSTSSPDISNKLKEVRNVGREQRRMALQQRPDTTVSRDNLSQSETLINWIRGRTTPKVMHI